LVICIIHLHYSRTRRVSLKFCIANVYENLSRSYNFLKSEKSISNFTRNSEYVTLLPAI